MNVIIKYKFIILAVIIGMLSVFPLLHPGFPPTHDGEYHVIRFYEFDKTLRSGSLYPRWAQDLNLGYGVPLFNYVYPVPNYVASFFHFLGFSFIDAFKLNMIIATILGSLSFYLWSKRYWGELGGLISSVFYSFTPYRLVDIYIRGSVGELWALSIMPAYLWAVDGFFENHDLKYFVLSTVFLSLIVFSHNILALILVSFSIFYLCLKILSSNKRKENAVEMGKMLILGIGISSIFWLPALFEKKFVVGLDVFDYARNFADIPSLLIPSWGSGFSGGDPGNLMSFQIGTANIIAVLLSILLIPLILKKRKTLRVILFFLISFLVVFLLMLKVSLPLWENVPLMRYFQFPWRFLSLELIITSFLAGSIVFILNILGKNRLSKVIGFALMIGAVLLSIGYSKPAYYHQRDDRYYVSRSNFIDGTNSPGNSFNTLWFNPKLARKNIRIVSKEADIKILNNKPTKIKAIIKTPANARITVNIAYFPTWSVYVDKKNVPVSMTSDGIFEFETPSGEHTVEVELKDSPVRIISYIFSLGSVGLLFGLFVRGKYIKIKE